MKAITISLGTTNHWDNDYTIYASGKVRRVYDQNQFKLNLEVWMKVSDLDKELRKNILKASSPDEKKRLTVIFKRFIVKPL